MRGLPLHPAGLKILLNAAVIVEADGLFFAESLIQLPGVGEANVWRFGELCRFMLIDGQGPRSVFFVWAAE